MLLRRAHVNNQRAVRPWAAATHPRPRRGVRTLDSENSRSLSTSARFARRAAITLLDAHRAPRQGMCVAPTTCGPAEAGAGGKKPLDEAANSTDSHRRGEARSSAKCESLGCFN
jgi:hypothetical protein